MNDLHTTDLEKKQFFENNKRSSNFWRCSCFWIPLAFCTLILIITDLVEMEKFSYDSFHHFQSIRNISKNLQSMHKKKEPKKFTINQKGCRIPYLDAFDKNIKQFISTPTPINCTTNSTAPDIIRYYRNGTIFIDTKQYTVLNNYSMSNTGLIKCCSREFWRIPPAGGVKDIKFEKNELCVSLKNDYYNTIGDEFVIIECDIENKTYKYVYPFVPQYKVNNKIKEQEKQLKKTDYLNVLLIGIDAVSRLNFHRQLPKTVTYLQDILQAKEMLGYNKIEDNTYPNLMALLTGLNLTEVDVYLSKTKNRRFDNCPIIWNEFHKKSYITAYAEDSTWMGLFTFNRRGFYNSTLDYDYRIFDQVATNLIGHKNVMNSKMCLGNKMKIAQLINYTRDFALTFKNNPYFGLFWGVSISHDLLNYPHLVDDDYYQLLKDLNEQGGLENTMLFFLSDHGIRWGGIRSTLQGYLEERLPILYVSPPVWFRDKYTAAWANIITNTQRLTTPYDLHQTFLDLLDLNQLTATDLKKRSENQVLSRGYSLFTPVPVNRTCKSAEIPQHWCTCQTFESISINDSLVQNVSKFVVSEINKLLVGYKQCAILKLQKIEFARIAETNTTENLKHYVHEYMVTLTTLPGEGQFEASVKVENDNKYELLGTISRTNLYGNQSRCISDFHLKLYCYCTSLLDSISKN